MDQHTAQPVIIQVPRKRSGPNWQKIQHLLAKSSDQVGHRHRWTYKALLASDFDGRVPARPGFQRGARATLTRWLQVR
eukprot:475536-Pyramimonas_sp.AAC.1